jgi:DNA-directed RNA polymerase specialized sigma24 family protein
MIALASAMSGRRLYDPEQTAQEGWHRFYPHWATCDNPPSYLRRCVSSAIRDELRALGSAPVLVHLGDTSVPVTVDLAHIPPGRQAVAAGESWSSWTSWDPPLAAAIASLSHKLREVVVLDTELHPGERPVAEIASILGIGRVAAHMRLKRAYDQLGRHLPASYLEERRERLRDAGGLEERSTP